MWRIQLLVVGVCTLATVGVHGIGNVLDNHIVPEPFGNNEFNLVYDEYCSLRPGDTCCPGRDDKCTMPIRDTVCYCDMFCNRTISDCCPDFFSFCLGTHHPWYGPDGALPLEGPGEEEILNKCEHDGHIYTPGDSIKMNCNNCSCELVGAEFNWRCEYKTCLVREDIISHVNTGNYWWQAGNYSFLWGLTLHEGMKYRLGTKQPIDPVKRMTSLRVAINDEIPRDFDARREWPGLIHPIMDQGNCGSSWAFSTVAVAADRLTLHSRGYFADMLSAQQLVSCNHDHDQTACNGGHLDRAWWFIRKYGLVSDDCYPYVSGATNKRGHCDLLTHHKPLKGMIDCPAPGGATSRVYHASPPYRIAPNEREIMKEILDNGPVQATLQVKEDFYMYRSGVYRYSMPANHNSDHTTTGFHSVRIIGWGDEYVNGRTIKYWLCANSWGSTWGEEGYFKIVRGTNECQIESFVIGVWGKVNGRQVSYQGNLGARNSRGRTKHHHRKQK